MDAASRDRPVLVTGATGAVGKAMVPHLAAAGWTPRCGSRDPARARATAPGHAWVRVDVDDPATLAPALEGCGAALYLVHGMADGKGYLERERAAARAFARAAAAAGVQRVVYLGGIEPPGAPSTHLRSRLETGALLRAGAAPCVELRAGMVIGGGSVSWRIVRDIAVRLPVQVLPAWLETRSQPIALADICVALEAALTVPLDGPSAVFDLPGPEILTGREILLRVGALLDQRPVQLPVPLLTPGLSAHWLRVVTRADPAVAKELVHGLSHDLLADGAGFWAHLPDHTRTPFDVAARAALAAESETVSRRSLRVERVIHRAAKWMGR